jgi:hypothetical protein
MAGKSEEDATPFPFGVIIPTFVHPDLIEGLKG